MVVINDKAPVRRDVVHVFYVFRLHPRLGSAGPVGVSNIDIAEHAGRRIGIDHTTAWQTECTNLCRIPRIQAAEDATREIAAPDMGDAVGFEAIEEDALAVACESQIEIACRGSKLAELF